jgi:hypothetical protein
MLWTFQWSGLTEAAIGDPFAVAAYVLAALLAVGVLVLILNPRTRTRTAFLLANWLAPIALTALLWSVRPLAHPRYTVVFSVTLFVLAAHVVVHVGRRPLGRALSICLVLVICANTVLALHAWYTNPRFGKDDVRGLAAWLASKTRASDLIIAPWRDWSLDYAYGGPAAIARPNPLDETETWHTLSDQTGPGKDVFLITYFRGTWDRRNILPFALESAGNLSERSTFKGLVARHYQLDRSVAPPQGSTTDARFGPLRLIAIWVEQDSPADTAITLAARWRLDERVTDRYQVGLRLQDPEGWTWTRIDDWLLDRRGFPTHQWEDGTTITSFHILPLTTGTPPLSYTVGIDVYAVDSAGQIRYLDLLDEGGNPAGQVYHTSPVYLGLGIGLDADPYRATAAMPPLAPPLAPAPGLALEAVDIDRHTVAPGQPIFVALRWRAETAPLPDLRPVLELRQDDVMIAAVSNAPAAGRYPTDQWRTGEVVLDRRRLTVPATARAGAADVTLCLNERCTVLGEVQVTVEQHLFEVPPISNEVHVRFGDTAELLGYYLAPPPYSSDRPITVTLYWQALEGAPTRDYTVFTHILTPDAYLVAQHDGRPVSGTRPTTGWLPGEVIIDEHPMTFREAYAGPALIEVGLYDPATLERVATSNGTDFVVLASQLSIDSP